MDDSQAGWGYAAIRFPTYFLLSDLSCPRMRYVEIYSRGQRRVVEIRVTKKYVTLFHLPSLRTMKVRPVKYEEIFLREVEADWPYLKRQLRKRVSLYDLKRKRYAKGLVEQILARKKDDEEIQG